MELKKIQYTSAVFFGVAALVMYFITGILQLIIVNQIPEYAQGQSVAAWQVIGLVPVIGAVVTYLIALIVIYIYNAIAKKYPISWEVKK